MNIPDSVLNQFANGVNDVNDSDEVVVGSRKSPIQEETSTLASIGMEKPTNREPVILHTEDSTASLADTLKIGDAMEQPSIQKINAPIEMASSPAPAPDAKSLLDDDEDDDVELVGVNTSNIDKKIDSNVTSYDEYNRILSEQMANMKKDAPDEFKTRSQELMDNITRYRKELMIQNGFTAAEADAAARKRLKNKATKLEAEYLEEHPELVVVTVDKTNSDSLNFTDEEKEKLVKTKKINLVEVEDRNLKTLKLKNVSDRKQRLNVIYRKSCNLSHYSVPCYNTVDYCTFSGATIEAIINAVRRRSKDEDGVGETAKVWVLRKAQFLYDHFVRSTTREKYDIDGNIIMTFNDFLRWYRYYDIDVGIYAIYVASSTEMLTSGFICNSNICKNEKGEGSQFDATYNTRSVIKYSDTTEKNQEVLDSILAAIDDAEEMKKSIDKYLSTKRMYSDFTKNCYDLVNPSIEDYLFALETLKDVKCEEAAINFVAWTRAIYVLENPDDPKCDVYIPITEPEDIAEYFINIVETEKFLLARFISLNIYKPYYSVNTVCPKCGNKSEVKMEIENLVFQRLLSLEAMIEV